MGTVYTDRKTSQVYILMQITLLQLEGKNRIKWRWYCNYENEAYLKGPCLLPHGERDIPHCASGRASLLAQMMKNPPAMQET